MRSAAPSLSHGRRGSARPAGLKPAARCAFAIVALAASTLCADDFTSRAIFSWQMLDQDALSTAGLRQTYDVRLDKDLTPSTTARVFFRAEDFHGSIDSSPVTVGSRRAGFRQLQPGGELLWQLPTLQMQTNYDRIHTNAANGDLATTRDLDRAMFRLFWTPEHLPGLLVQGHRNRSSDEASGLNTSDELASASLDYAWKGLRVIGTERYSKYDDGHYGFARKSIDHQAELLADESYFGGKLIASANGSATLTTLNERAAPGASPASIPNPDHILHAYAGVDDTPLDDRDHPLSAVPSLIDGNVSTSSGINLGPDGASYRNIEIDLGRVIQLDEVRVIVRDGAGNPVKLGGGVVFDAYSSNDEVNWVPLTTPAVTTFDSPLSLYHVTFPQITTRWFKLVSFGVNGEATFVTEVEAYYHTTLAGGGMRTTDMRVYSGTATVIARPAKWTTLMYYGLVNSASQRPSDTPLTATTDVDHVVTAQFDPLRWMSLTLRYDNRSVTQTAQLGQTSNMVSAFLRLVPVRQLDVTLETDRQDENNQGREIATNTAVLHTFARLLPSLDLTFDIGSQQQDFVTDAGRSTRHFITGVGNAQLTRTVRLMLTTSVQRVTFAGNGAVDGLLPARDDRYSAEVTWRPGQPFAISARYGWVIGELESGMTQRYRVEWYPFAQGTVSIGGTYDQDIDPYSQRRSSRLMFTPRWTMNRHAIVDVNYTSVKGTGSVSSNTRSFFATFTLIR